MDYKVLKFANDFQKEIRKNRTKAFYSFYKCSYECFQDKINEQCIPKCEEKLDEYLR